MKNSTQNQNSYELIGLNKDEVLKSMSLEFGNYSLLLDSIKADPDIAIMALKTAMDKDENTEFYDSRMRTVFSDVPFSLRGNKDFLIKLFNSIECFDRMGKGIVNRIDKDLLTNEALGIAIVKNYPEAFPLLGDNVKDDDRVVILATKTNGELIEFASERCQANRKIQAEIVCNSESWGVHLIPLKIIDTQFMRDIYEVSPMTLLKLRDSNPFSISTLANINEALNDPRQTKLFYIKKLDEADAKLTTIENRIHKTREKVLSHAQTDDGFNNLVLIELQKNLNEPIPAIKHMTDQLTLNEIRACNFQSQTIKTDVIQRRELLAIKQNSGSHGSIVPHSIKKRSRKHEF